MLERIDRIQMVVPDRAEAASRWATLLGAEPEGEDRVAGLAALRSRYRIGDGFVEFLSPDGAGPVADALAERGAHLFAAGASTNDLGGVLGRVRAGGGDPLVEGDQIHLAARDTGGHGLRLVVSREASRPRVGALRGLYEVTNLVQDVKQTVDGYVQRFGLDASSFTPIESTHYGYRGSLTLFHPEELHRFEVIQPYDLEKTMGRFFRRSGESLYMAFAESDELETIEARAQDRGVGFTAVPPAKARGERGADTVFLHPPALGGMMLGISRTTYAWTWSGLPERAQSAS